MKKIILLTTLITASVTFAQDYPKSLPDFKIQDLEKQSFNQNNVTADTFSYFIYFNPTCGHCQTAFKTLNLHVDKLKDKNSAFKLYPVSAKDAKDTKAFFKNYAPNLLSLDNMQVLLDDNNKFADTFFVGGYPTSYLYDKNQKLVKVINGADNILSFLEEIK